MGKQEEKSKQKRQWPLFQFELRYKF